MRKEDWEDREEEVQRLARMYEDRLATQRLLLVEAHDVEMEAARKVRGLRWLMLRPLCICRWIAEAALCAPRTC